MKNKFRAFVNERFMAHKDECKWYRIPCRYKTLKTYYNQNKKFLIKQFKEERKHER